MMKDVKGSCTNFTQPVCLQKECISLAFGVSVGGFGILARSWLESASPELVSTPQQSASAMRQYLRSLHSGFIIRLAFALKSTFLAQVLIILCDRNSDLRDDVVCAKCRLGRLS